MQPRALAPPSNDITVKLTTEQLERVRRYAVVNCRGDVDRATQDLLDFVIRSWLSEPER